MKINAKFSNISTSFITSIKPLIKAHKAINLAAGHTGFHCSPHLIKLVEKHLREGVNRHADPSGELRLRQGIANKIQDLYDRRYHPESELTITAGATQGIFTAIAALVREGDEVIIFEPANEYYISAIEMNGAQVISVPMGGDNYYIDWELMQQMISSKTRMIIINTPHTPTGWVMDEIDLLRLQKIISGTDIIVVSEETFEHIVFDGHMHQSIALFPKLAERSLIISSLGETYHVTGWQLGYCAAPAIIMKEFRKVHEAIMQSVNSPFQMAMADFIGTKEEYQKLAAFYQDKRDRFIRMMQGTGLKPLPCSGTYFQLFDYGNVSDEKDRDFVIRLIKEHGVATLPISAFMKERQQRTHIRINFARPDDMLAEAARRLSSLKE
ncbi:MULTISPECIES: methionine aminotransferase [unclassified Carboxylicivirga]|uniref:methionine aminotransferase n=1 Tax=Carboxylicivirga TaxID=1628153 RepID=UPI003D33A66F